jgi:hypothetical protein
MTPGADTYFKANGKPFYQPGCCQDPTCAVCLPRKPRLVKSTPDVELTDKMGVSDSLKTEDLEKPKMSVYSLEGHSDAKTQKIDSDHVESVETASDSVLLAIEAQPEPRQKARRRGRPRRWNSDADRKRATRGGAKVIPIRPDQSVLDSVPKAVRSNPSSSKPSKILLAEKVSEQGNRCTYCGHGFGTAVRADGKIHVLEPQVDHVKPPALRKNDSVSNIVAACQICNITVKRNHVFESVEQAREIIQAVWSEREYAVESVDQAQVIDRFASSLQLAKDAAPSEEPKTQLKNDWALLNSLWTSEKFQPSAVA